VIPAYRPSPLKLRRANLEQGRRSFAKAASLMRATGWNPTDGVIWRVNKNPEACLGALA
jgi:hypothetical protein